MQIEKQVLLLPLPVELGEVIITRARLRTKIWKYKHGHTSANWTKPGPNFQL